MSLLSCSAPRMKPENVKDEIEALSDEEREQIQRDVHGTEEAIRESPEFIRDALECLDIALQEISEKEAFDLALIVCPEYVKSDDFRLLFLRAERFDISNAAQKLVNYWEKKVELFGPNRAFRKISIEDVNNDEDRLALEMGGIRVMPDTDSAGRGIFISHRVNWDLRRGHESSMIRLLWYNTHVALENVDIQKNGIVIILANGLPLFSASSYNAKLNRKLYKDGLAALPVRIQALHQAAEGKFMKLVIETNMFAIGSKLRSRFRAHAVKPAGLMEELEPYRIPASAVPVEFGGEAEYNHQEWLQDRYRRENMNDIE